MIANRARLLAASAAFGVLLAAPVAGNPKPDISGLAAGPIDLKTSPIRSFIRGGGEEIRFGKLAFRGGLVLTAPDAPNFGGWSGIVLDDDARRFLSVSDSGVWLTGEIQYDGETLTGISDARIGPLMAADGNPLRRRKDRDAEAIAVAEGTVHSGAVFIAFEHKTRIVRYDVTPDGLFPSRDPLDKPAPPGKLRRNAGIEAMTIVRGGPYEGATVAIAERYLDKALNHTGWIWTNSGAREFHLTNVDDYDITDVASLDDGTLFVLERRFRWMEGVKMRIRRFGPHELAPGQTAEGETLIEATLDQEIDNMEGLAATRTKSGDVLLTVISDDNFNRYLQRTVLLQFTLSELQTVKAKPRGSEPSEIRQR